MQTEILNTFVPQQYSPSAILNLGRKLLVHPLIQSAQESFRSLQNVILGDPGALSRRDIFGRSDIFGRRLTSRSKPLFENTASTENIASSRLTAPGSSRMLKGNVWPEMWVIFHPQPNRPGIKLRVGDDWFFSWPLKYVQNYKWDQRSWRRRKSYSPIIFCLVQFFTGSRCIWPDNFTNFATGK